MGLKQMFSRGKERQMTVDQAVQNLPAAIAGKERHGFADYLLSGEMVQKVYLEAALREQKVTGERIGAILVRNGFLPQKKLVNAILDFSPENIATETVSSSRIPLDILERMSIVISAETEDTVFVGTMSDERQVAEIVREYYPEKKYRPVSLLPEHLPEFLDRVRKAGSFGDDADTDTPEGEMLERLISTAIKANASDIHIEPRERSYSVLFRILGVRYLKREGDVEEYNTIRAQIKDRSRMDLAEQRLPQDGGFQLEFSGRFVDLRVATIPAVTGEQIVIRILDPERTNPDLDAIGISRIEQWRKGITRQNGLCLICGETGSGKTTTLNSSVRQLDRFEKKIYTIEDPVEYRIPFVGQVATNQQVGLDYSRGLRSFMRADPDVIIIGEVRDEETARNAIKAADTGHLVIATLHTSSILSSMSRLRDLKIPPHELIYMLRCVLVQSLVRVICRTCDGEGEKHGAVCPTCSGIGYSGRTIISEAVAFDHPGDVSDVIDMLGQNGEKVTSRGTMPWPEMIDDALDKMVAGLTSIEELRRIFGMQANERAKARGIDPSRYHLRKADRKVGDYTIEVPEG